MTSKKESYISCIEDLASELGLTIKEFKKYSENKMSTDDEEYIAVYPHNQNLIYSNDKIYVQNLKVMLGQNLYKDGKMIQMNDKLSKILDIENPPINWYISEKWDGIRAIWDGEKFVSRGNNAGNPKVYSYVPPYFIELMPPGIALDGEIWIGRGEFSKASRLSTLKIGRTYKTSKELNALWIGKDNVTSVKYKVFDLPNSTQNFEHRYLLLQDLIKNRILLWNKIKSKYKISFDIDCPLQLTTQTKIVSMEQLISTYNNLTSIGAEGVMLRAPNSPYEQKRSKYLLKYKIKEDAEAVVIEYLLGTGRLKGLLGSLKCELIVDGKLSGINFNLGSGFSDEQRTEYNDPKSINYIPIGSIISFSFMELSKDSVPRHPVYKGIRDDISILEKDKEVKETDIDYRKHIIDTFITLIKALEVSKEPNWQFKRKSYKQVVDILNSSDEKIKNVNDALRVLRNGGTKFEGEEAHFTKNGEYKSRIIVKINSIIKTGIFAEAEEIKNDPKMIAVSELSQIPEIGPAKALKLYEDGIKSIADLKLAISKNKSLLNNKQLIGLEHYEDLQIRIPRSEMNDWNNIFKLALEDVLKKLKINFDEVNYQMVGSYRRGSESSGDIDVLLTSKLSTKQNNLIFKNFVENLYKKKYLDEELVFSYGKSKFMGLGLYDEYYRHIDLFFYTEQEYPFALLYSTGSAQFNIEMRAYALKLKYSLNEKQLYTFDKSKKLNPVTEDEYLSDIGKPFPTTEEDIFKFLGLQYIIPSERQAGMIITSKK